MSVVICRWGSKISVVSVLGAHHRWYPLLSLGCIRTLAASRDSTQPKPIAMKQCTRSNDWFLCQATDWSLCITSYYRTRGAWQDAKTMLAGLSGVPCSCWGPLLYPTHTQGLRGGASLLTCKSHTRIQAHTNPPGQFQRFCLFILLGGIPPYGQITHKTRRRGGRSGTLHFDKASWDAGKGVRRENPVYSDPLAAHAPRANWRGEELRIPNASLRVSQRPEWWLVVS